MNEKSDNGGEEVKQTITAKNGKEGQYREELTQRKRTAQWGLRASQLQGEEQLAKEVAGQRGYG